MTEKSAAGNYFTEQVDSKEVYVNASTRFTVDGGQFGLGTRNGYFYSKTSCQRSYGAEKSDQL